MKPKAIFNTASHEPYDQARIIGGNPNGIINYEKSNHSWGYQLYKNMLARSWFPSQINVSKDKVNYPRLTDAEKRMYDLVLAQLITNDSIQTNQLMDRINCYITSPVVNAAIVLQSRDEAIHAESYSIIAEEICADTDRIFDMHNHDEELANKNKAVERMYLSLYNGDDPSKEDLLLAFAANQILESMVFPMGFCAILSLDEKMSGTAEMISEISGTGFNGTVNPLI